MKDLLYDSTQFKRIIVQTAKELNHLINAESQVIKVINTLFKPNRISQKDYEFIYPNWFQLRHHV